jgi:D-inositol-3-phosphate glycosyltransferase
VNKQRVAMISYHTCPLAEEEGKEVGGMNVYVLELSKQLALKGYLVDIYVRKQSNNDAKIVNISKNLRVVHLRAGEETDIPRKILYKYIPEFLENFYSFIKKEGISYNIINCHYYLSGLIGLEVKRKYSVPFTITFHSLALMKNLVARDEEEKEDDRRVRAEILLARNADRIIATSSKDKKYLRSLYNCPKEKISIITPAVDTKVFRPINKAKAKKVVGVNTNEDIILYVGRIVPLKGIDSLLYSIKILQEKDPRLKLSLWIVGEEGNSHADKLNYLKTLLNLQASIKFVGKQTQGKLPYYYNSSKIVVMPSYYESFGIVALESMACGIPVVITEAAGVSELFAKNSPLVASSSSPLLLAEKIGHLLKDKEDYTQLSKAIFVCSQALNWESVAKKFIEEVLS